MPRFSETEKEIIRQKLMREGERLFSVFGIKKVSIDELVQATGIAKGSFYAFFPSKEHLFIEIVFNQQKQIWAEMEEFLQTHCGLPPRKLVKQVFLWMLEQAARYPLIQRVDQETTEYLYRKLPKEVLAAHTQDDGANLLELEKYGVRFNCGIPMAAKILQTLAVSFFTLASEDEAMRPAIIETILDGVLKEIVEV